MHQLIIKGGRLIDPARGVDQRADVLIADGVVREISTTPGGLQSASSNAESIDAEGCIVSPGLIDPHVHLREPHPAHEETILTGALACARGGFTTVCCMPNTSPALDTPAMMEFVGARAADAVAAGGARVHPVGCGTIGRKGETPTDVVALVKAGALAISDDGDAIADDDVMRRVLELVKSAGSVFMQHCQDPEQTVGSVMNAGVVAARLGLVGWPREAEYELLERDIRLNYSIGARYHAQHMSCAESIDAIRKAREDHQPVSGEAAPHHLLLTDDACASFDPNTKVNPPLRTQRDVNAVKQGVADGTLTVLATDHAPHPMNRKSLSFTEAPFGFATIECALALYINALIDDNVLDWPTMLRLMTINPAQLVGLDQQGFGSLAPGSVGDVTVIDPEHAWTIEPRQFVSRGRNCPFAGWRVKGAAVATVIGGRIVHALEGSRVAAQTTTR